MGVAEVRATGRDFGARPMARRSDYAARGSSDLLICLALFARRGLGDHISEPHDGEQLNHHGQSLAAHFFCHGAVVATGF